MTKTESPVARAVIICTTHRGVFFGWARKSNDDILRDERVELTNARMAIRFGTTHGVMQLAHRGPTDKSLIGAPADIALNAVSAVITVTPDAVKAWEQA